MRSPGRTRSAMLALPLLLAARAAVGADTAAPAADGAAAAAPFIARNCRGVPQRGAQERGPGLRRPPPPRVAGHLARGLGEGGREAADPADAAASAAQAGSRRRRSRSCAGSRRSWRRSEAARPPNPGRVTARRLNRTEYDNTVRDLLGVEPAAGRRLPAGRRRLRLRQHRRRALASRPCSWRST